VGTGDRLRSARLRGKVVSPADTWKFGRNTCAYVAAMVRSWGRPSDVPKAGRHQWAMTRCVRLAAAHRHGCITQHGPRPGAGDSRIRA